MGLTEACGGFRPFASSDATNKRLVVEMLKYEDSLIHGEQGQSMYRDPSYQPARSLDVEHGVQRMVLTRFGFRNDDDDVSTYRTIFRTYYQGPTDYDAEVLGSVTYMRENRCLYYTAPPIRVGDAVSDLLAKCMVHVADVDNVFSPTRRSLIDIVTCAVAAARVSVRHVFVGAFSGS